MADIFGTADYAEGTARFAENELGGTASAGPHSSALVRACLDSFGRVLDAGGLPREVALDLLSADAFVTYAFEAAADDPTTITSAADEAMRAVSDLAVARLSQEHP